MRALEVGKVTVFDKTYDVYGYSDDTWYQDLKSKGVWNEFRLSHLEGLIAADDICLDLGANVGMMTLALAALTPKGHVYAFEGSPETTLALQETVKANDLPNVDAYNVIVGRSTQAVKFFDMPDVRSSGHYVPAEAQREVTSLWQDTSQMILSHTKSVDDLVEELRIPKVDFIKIDVEGAELDVMAGAEKTLSRWHPMLIMEFNSYAYTHLREIPPRRALCQILDAFDQVYYFQNRTGDLVRLKNTERARERFLHDNLFNGFVDDLLCVYADSRLAKSGAIEREMKIGEFERRLREKERELAEKQALLAEKQATLAETQAMLAETQAMLAETQAMLEAKLQEKDAHIASIYNSRSWRMTAPARRITTLLRR
jgi:FkbM family methyltransferase